MNLPKSTSDPDGDYLYQLQTHLKELESSCHLAADQLIEAQRALEIARDEAEPEEEREVARADYDAAIASAEAEIDSVEDLAGSLPAPE